MKELRITDTNSVTDSKGRAFGLEGNDFLYVLGAAVAALALYLLLVGLFRVGMLAALILVLPVFVGPAAWVLLLRHNKPDGYAEDVFDDLVSGEGWSLAQNPQSQRPGQGSHE